MAASMAGKRGKRELRLWSMCPAPHCLWGVVFMWLFSCNLKNIPGCWCECSFFTVKNIGDQSRIGIPQCRLASWGGVRPWCWGAPFLCLPSFTRNADRVEWALQKWPRSWHLTPIPGTQRWSWLPLTSTFYKYLHPGFDSLTWSISRHQVFMLWARGHQVRGKNECQGERVLKFTMNYLE